MTKLYKYVKVLILCLSVTFLASCTRTTNATSPVKGVSPRLCALVSQGNPKYSDNMDALAKKAHLKGNYWNRYHEDVVGYLCKGDLANVKSEVDNGFVTSADVQGIRQALSDGVAPPTITTTRSAGGRCYGDTRRRLVNMGLCSACADNTAEFYCEKPTSRCGLLTAHALAGDPKAAETLQDDPPYCQVGYK